MAQSPLIVVVTDAARAVLILHRSVILAIGLFVFVCLFVCPFLCLLACWFVLFCFFLSLLIVVMFVVVCYCKFQQHASVSQRRICSDN